MRTFPRWCWFGILLLLGTARAEDGMTARVKGDRINLRARPDQNGEVAGQLNESDVLKVRSVGDPWIEVYPPAQVRFWIHRDFLDGNQVKVKRLNVRAGASVNYPVVGYLNRGDVIAPLETFGEWVAVAPPAESSLWINREFVELIPPVKPAPAATVPAVLPPSARPPTPSPRIPPSPSAAVPAAPAREDEALPVPPADLNLVPLPGQGKLVQRDGELKPAPFLFGRPGKYRLVARKGQSLDTLCYLRGNQEQLQSMLNERLVIRGREYWVQGVKEPVVVVERIERRVKLVN